MDGARPDVNRYGLELTGSLHLFLRVPIYRPIMAPMAPMAQTGTDPSHADGSAVNVGAFGGAALKVDQKDRWISIAVLHDAACGAWSVEK